MIKKNKISQEDIKTWKNYIKNPKDIVDKDNYWQITFNGKKYIVPKSACSELRVEDPEDKQKESLDIISRNTLRKTIDQIKNTDLHGKIVELLINELTVQHKKIKI